MNITRTTFCALAVAFAGHGYGAAPEGYVSLNADGESFDTNINWSDGNAPSPGKKYYVPKSITLSSAKFAGTAAPSVEHVFKGDELIVDGLFNPRAFYNEFIVVSNLVMRGGGQIRCASVRSALRGLTTLSGTSHGSTFAMIWTVPNANGAAECSFNLIGDANQVMHLYYGGVANSFTNAWFAFTGDLTGYAGTIVADVDTKVFVNGVMPGAVWVNRGSAISTQWRHDGAQCYCRTGANGRHEATEVFGDSSVGSLLLHKGATANITAGRTLTVGDLTLEAGAKIVLANDNASCGKLVVTDSLSCPDKIPVRLVMPSLASGPVPEQTILRFGPGILPDLTADDIDLTTDLYNGLPTVTPVVKTEPDGWRSVVVQFKEVVQLVNDIDSDDSSNYWPWNQASNGTKCAFWSDGKAPHAGCDYLSVDKNVRPPVGAAIISFAGDSLTLVGGGISSGNKRTAGISIRDLRFYGASIMNWLGVLNGSTYGDDAMEISGGTCAILGATPTTFCAFGGARLLRINSELIGNGDVIVKGRETSASAKGDIELTGFNTNYLGSIYVTMPDNASKGNPSESNYTTLYLRDGRNLGGPLPTFKADAFRIDQKSMLKVVGNATLDQTNRGLTANGFVRFNVTADKALTIMNPLTLGGTIRSEGEGLLALGGELRFVNGEPEADKNVLQLNAGSIKPLSTNACDGLAIKIANDTVRFVFDIDPTGDGMKEFGLMDVRWPTPIAFENGASKINVEFDTSVVPTAPVADVRLGLFTVATKALAEDIRARISVTKPYCGREVDLSVEQNSHGSWTVYGTISRHGLMVLII